MLENHSELLETQLEGDVKLSELKKDIEQKVRKRFKATCERIAELKLGQNAGWKHRARAIASAVGVTGSRAKTIIYDEHRSVHAHEYIIAERTVERLELKAVEQQAIRGMEMGIEVRGYLDSATNEHDIDLGGVGFPTSREMAQELKVRLGGIK